MGERTRHPGRGDRIFWWAFALMQGFFLLWVLAAGTMPAEVTVEEDGFTNAMAVWTTMLLWLGTDLIVGGGYALRKVIKQ